MTTRVPGSGERRGGLGPSTLWTARLGKLIGWVGGTIVLSSAGPALAQEFVKVPDGAREQLPASPFVGAAYGFIWVALLLYVVVVARGVARVQRDIQDLRRRLDRGDADPDAVRRS